MQFSFGTYEAPKKVGYAGWIRQSGSRWTIFLPLKAGKPTLFVDLPAGAMKGRVRSPKRNPSRGTPVA